MTARELDVAIVGGGLAGASLAAALAQSEIDAGVIESREAHDPAQLSFDERSVALTYDARQLYESFGIWNLVESVAQPIREIHISDRGHFGMAHLRASDAGAEALGYVLPARKLGEALHARMRESGSVKLFCPATLRAATLQNEKYALDIESEDGMQTLHAQLVVLADGGRSGLAAQFGIAETETRAYSQRAILCLISTDRDHHGRAYERFTREGPLALLPFAPRRYAVVWSSDAARAESRLALGDEEFCAALQSAFGFRAGNFFAPGARRAYALRRGCAHPLGARALSIGDAAHVVHPVAGQGFNLGLRDAAVLAALLQRAAKNPACDFGAREILKSYAAARRGETARVSAFTGGLLRVFGGKNCALNFARNAALAAIELCPPAKRIVLTRTMGMSARARFAR